MERRRWKLKMFAAGLGIRLAGAGLIVLGDKHAGLFFKALVIVGVVLSVGGIGVLKFLLYHGMHAKPPPPPANESLLAPAVDSSAAPPLPMADAPPRPPAV